MKVPLTETLVKKLELKSKPIGFDEKGKIVFEPNPKGKDYILFCAHQKSPPGFGVKIAGKKTWIIQRRVPGSERVIKSTVGNCADLSLDEARERAAAYAKIIVETGCNPNASMRRQAEAEITLGGAMAAYKRHLQTRKKRPARPNTIKNFERSERRFKQAGWWGKRVRDIRTADVIKLFEEKMESAPTANEQNFDWASLAIRNAIDHELLDAAAANRSPVLTASPFKILKLKKMYRDPAEVEAARNINRSINPLGPTTDLGKFLEAAWARRGINNNGTAVDFIITALAVGARKTELGTVVWGELLSTRQRDDGEVSHVWLAKGGEYDSYIFFSADVTKNRRAHRIPLGPFIANLLRRRQREAAEITLSNSFGRKGREWVFPARNKQASTKGGYYKDPGALLDALASEVEVETINPHDLRRSFGAVMTALNVPNSIMSRLLNHTTATPKTMDEIAASTTARYVKAEWALLREWSEKIQEYIFITAPNLYNSVRPEDRPAIVAPSPHVPRSPKPRSGRPRKNISK